MSLPYVISAGGARGRALALLLLLLLLLLLEPEARNKALVALVALAWRVDDGVAGAVGGGSLQA
jgi:hypothetical protein